MLPIPPYIEPEWPAPDSVLALSTTRSGGHSTVPFDSFNLGDHVGDSSAAVAANRATLALSLPADYKISWLSQVHGTGVIEAGIGSVAPEGDASWSRDVGVACSVLTADCLPVLFCSASGDVVAAAHAGWRGLLAGVLESTVTAMATDSAQVLAWLGPAIGPTAFEVGPEVKQGFLAAAHSECCADVSACFVPNPARSNYFFADLYRLARLRLSAIGVTQVFGGSYCTHSEPSHFFSYRRDGKTGRMASLIALRNPGP